MAALTTARFSDHTADMDRRRSLSKRPKTKNRASQSSYAARITVALKTHNNYYAHSWLALKPRIVAFVYCASWLLRRLAVKTSLSASKSVKWKPI